jgi:hypothetical protein
MPNTTAATMTTSTIMATAPGFVLQRRRVERSPRDQVLRLRAAGLTSTSTLPTAPVFDRGVADGTRAGDGSAAVLQRPARRQPVVGGQRRDAKARLEVRGRDVGQCQRRLGRQRAQLGRRAVLALPRRQVQAEALADAREGDAFPHRLDRPRAVLVEDLDVVVLKRGAARALLPVGGVDAEHGDPDLRLAGTGAHGLYLLVEPDAGGRAAAAEQSGAGGGVHGLALRLHDGAADATAT